MGLLDGVMGNASKIDAAKSQEEFSRILAPGEVVEHAYQLIRDYFVFTNKRLVLVDKQGMTGSKVEYHSLPYKSITHFSNGGRVPSAHWAKWWPVLLTQAPGLSPHRSSQRCPPLSQAWLRSPP